MQSRNCAKAAEEAEAVKASLTKGQQNAVEQASERGTSTWLTAIQMTYIVWFSAEQTGLQRHALFEIWLDAREVALALPMWGGVHSGTCLAFNQA